MIDSTVLTKKNSLYFMLILLSLLFGAVLGALNLFGFFDDRQAIHFTLLLTSILTAYAINIVLFLLDFAPGNHIYRIFSLSCLAFGIIFIIASMQLLTAVAATFTFYLFLNFSYRQVIKWSRP